MRKLVVIAALAFAACNSGDGGGSNTVETPAFSPAAGTYATVQNVTITCATAGATIHYTLDGSTPTASSPTYSNAMPVTTTTTIKAFAMLAGMTDSAVASATYTLQAGTPVISPPAGTYATAQNVTITSATPTATIHYTVDGSTPTSASQLYTAPIPLPVGATAATTTVKAIALRTGFADSVVASSTFVMDPAATPAAAPTFTPPEGTYAAAQSVTIATTTTGVEIYYTTDGSTPTTASTRYTAPVQVGTSLTLRAIATGGSHTASPVASAAYVINLPKAATPTFTPAGGSYTSAQNVTIASTTTGAVIYYTTDGSTPTASSTLYSAPVAVTATRTLKAIATATGFAASDVGTASYVIGSGTGTDFQTVCTTYIGKTPTLFTDCLHANPDWVNSLLLTTPTFCADTQKEINQGLITYSPALGAACASAVQALTCNDLVGDSGFPTPASCEAALVGTVNTGGTCYSSTDCKAGFCTWDLASGTCPGTCQPYATLGQSCASAICATGLACFGSPQTCQTESAAGGPCPCKDNLRCDTSGGGAGVCTAYLATGAPCDKSNDHCNFLALCVGSPATCQAYVGLGATCNPAPGESLCGIGYVCNATTNKCVSWPKLGEACTLDVPCIASYCDFVATSPTCKAKLADGATCNPALFGTDCLSASCDAATNKCKASSSNRCALP
jgi:hypothetical protein